MDDHSKGSQREAMFPQPPGVPWLIQIDVYLDESAPKGFRIESCLPQKIRTIVGQKENYIIFDNRGRPGFRIHFELHDPKGEYTFPDDPQDAVWSKIGDECPHSAVHEVFKPEGVIGPNGTTLVVCFPNETDIGDFRYTLNVTNTGTKPYRELDPGGTGNNSSNNWY